MHNVQKYFEQVNELKRINPFRPNIPTAAIMGPYNTGKSTLVNKLLGENISPVDIVPTTPVPVYFSYGKHFIARAHFSNQQVKILTAGQMASLIAPKQPDNPHLVKIEVNINSPLLLQMNLIDTPGNDAPHDSPRHPDLRSNNIEHIVYLLHQRGPGETDRVKIQELVQLYGAGRISFWINCNLGRFDGTSLEEARNFLRELCCSEVTVYPTNTIDPVCVQKLRLFIEERAADVYIKAITAHIRDLDEQIPPIIETCLNTASDAEFLLNFWEAREKSSQIVNSQNIIKTLPPVARQIRVLLGEPTQPANTPTAITLTSKSVSNQPDPVKLKEMIQLFIKRVISDPAMSELNDITGQLAGLYGRLERDNCLVTTAGGFSSGKSTFLNALIGEEILPAENRPTTFGITHLRHGRQKKATITFASRVTIPTHYQEDGFVTICRHELATLEKWLNDPTLVKKINDLHKVSGGKLYRVTTRELLQEMEHLKEYFARVQRNFKNGKRPWKSLFKKIPLHKFISSKRADQFIVTFPDQEQVVLNLENGQNRDVFKKLAGSHLALGVENIVLEHPADILRLATFVDTPGMDSVYHRHRDITAGFLPASDCFLFFLNGKHVLTKPDLGVMHMLLEAMRNNPETVKKLLIIVNFADALTAREQEKVCHYLRQNMPHQANRPITENIYLISSLDALTDRDKKNFTGLLQQLKCHIWDRRAALYLSIIRKVEQLLRSILEKDCPVVDTGQTAQELHNQAADTLLDVSGQITGWQNHLVGFTRPDDFIGFRDGRQIAKKFLGLGRKTVPVPCCREMCVDINLRLAQLYDKWKCPAEREVPQMDVRTIQQGIDDVLHDHFDLKSARRKLDELLENEYCRIQSGLQGLAPKLVGQWKPKSQSSHHEIAPNVIRITKRYLSELKAIEKKLPSPGGMDNAERQSLG